MMQYSNQYSGSGITRYSTQIVAGDKGEYCFGSLTNVLSQTERQRANYRAAHTQTMKAAKQPHNKRDQIGSIKILKNVHKRA